jgi:hypothetical protein
MQCRNCGTEIADKAIVCYRCGTATTDPVRKPAPVPTPGGGPPLLAAVIPLLVALVLVAGAQPSGYPREADLSAAILATAGVVMLIVRLLRRR